MKRNGTTAEQKAENYRWRSEALDKKIGLEELAIVLQKINGQIHGTSGYLGAISDRSKELYFNHQTVGQYQMQLLEKDPNTSLRTMCFTAKTILTSLNVYGRHKPPITRSSPPS